MAKPILPTNFKNDVLPSGTENRKYHMINNDDGTVSFEDVTEYSQEGDLFGASQINAMNSAINQSVDDSKRLTRLSDVKSATVEGFIADAIAIKELNSELSGKLGGMRFYEENGNKYVVGADSVPKKLGDPTDAIEEQIARGISVVPAVSAYGPQLVVNVNPCQFAIVAVALGVYGGTAYPGVQASTGLSVTGIGQVGGGSGTGGSASVALYLYKVTECIGGGSITFYGYTGSQPGSTGVYKTMTAAVIYLVGNN